MRSGAVGIDEEDASASEAATPSSMAWAFEPSDVVPDDDLGARFARDVRRAVGRAVVDDDDLAHVPASQRGRHVVGDGRRLRRVPG